MKKNKLYLFLLLACLAGGIYTAVLYSMDTTASTAGAGVCLLKHVAGIPCPSCGSTRSVLSLLHGDITSAILWNPIGLILFAIMFMVPIWILYDFISRKSTLFVFYTRAEYLLKQKKIFIPAICIMLVNWIWNIYKGL